MKLTSIGSSFEGLQGVRYTEAFQFGGKSEWLAGLVAEGKKRATCG